MNLAGSRTLCCKFQVVLIEWLLLFCCFLFEQLIVCETTYNLWKQRKNYSSRIRLLTTGNCTTFFFFEHQYGEKKQLGNVTSTAFSSLVLILRLLFCILDILNMNLLWMYCKTLTQDTMIKNHHFQFNSSCIHCF